MFTHLIITATKLGLAACLLTTNALFANPVDPAKPTSFNASLFVTKANKIRISIEKITPEPVIISLHQQGKNQDNVFRQEMRKKQAKLAVQLDVSDLADGIYELEIQSAKGHVSKRLTIATPQWANESSRTIVLP